MELELQLEHQAYYRALDAVCAVHEESAEVTLPEHCMDAARIVCAEAAALLRSYEFSGGKLNVSGEMRVCVLYLAEDAAGLRSFETSLPFVHSFSDGISEEPCDVSLHSAAAVCEARLIHPRKLALRVSAELRAQPYARSTLTTCPAVPEGWGIEARTETEEVSLLCAIREKDFLFADEVTLHGARQPIAELLCRRARVRVTECRPAGGKVVLKGIASVTALYRGSDDTLACLEEELPFSQLVEGLGGEDGECGASVHLTGCELYADGEEGRSVSVKLYIHAFVTLRRRASVTCVTDLYSTTHTLDAEFAALELPQAPKVRTRALALREQLAAAVAPRSVLCADVLVTGICGDRGVRTLLRALYLDESGAPLCTERRIELPADEGEAPGAEERIWEAAVGAPTCSVNAEGVELRASVELQTVSEPAARCESLRALRAEAREPEDGPALVLRPLAPGETLWTLAKRCRTTVGEILAANELESESAAAAGQLLLIPCGK